MCLVFFMVELWDSLLPLFSIICQLFYFFESLGQFSQISCFSFIITSFACYHGDRCFGGAEGVGKATTSTVVYSSVAILVMDFIVAWFLFGGY